MKNGFMKRLNYILPFFTILLLLGACDKLDKIQPDPYSGGKQPLGIAFAQDTLPNPSHGNAGDLITYRIHGLSKYKMDDFEVYLHREKAEIKNVTDSSITIKAPASASTGELMLYVKGQVFFGPTFKVDGKVNVDPTFKSGNGTDLFINDVIEMTNTNLFMVGAFANYDLKAATQPINRIVETNIDGQFVSTLLSGEGANGVLNSIVELPGNKILIGGGFSSFGNHKGILNVTRLNRSGSLDTMTVAVTPMPEKPIAIDTVPAFNGGVSGSVTNLFYYKDRIYAVGNFNSYGSYYYPTSTYETKILDETKVNQMVSMKLDGEMDSTFNYDKTADKPYPGGNGPINDAVLLDADGSIVLAGGFNKFDNIDAGGVVKVNINDGLPEPTFNSGVGADGEVTTVNYNETQERFILSGPFRAFNGESYDGIVMLKKDGKVDNNFKPKKIAGGTINFAAQLDNGRIIVSGSFKTYGNVYRGGFMILNPDGTLAEGYNNTGDFQGQIEKIYQTRSALGRDAVLLVGLIKKFDGQEAHNLVRIEIQ